MAVQQLSTLVTTSALRSPNFFNGRLLTGEDLSAEHRANQQGRDLLGQAIGDGVVDGLELEVAATSTSVTPVITVKRGLAINRAGHPLVLTDDLELSLVARPDATTTPSSSGAAGTFGNCQPPQAGVYVSGAGVYLLVLAPASGTEGRAQISGLGNADATCNTRSMLDGVQFRLVQLPLGATDLNDARHVRNRVAHRCFGTSDKRFTGFVVAPFVTPATEYGLLDDLRGAALTDCDVPLGLIYWTAQAGIVFIDVWSVRRRTTRKATTSHWPLLIGDRRASEQEAVFLQFQAHLAWLLVSVSNVNLAQALDYFDYLPPIGVLPLASASKIVGFNASVFFAGITVRQPAYITGAQVGPLVSDALRYSPIDMHHNPAVLLYQVHENSDPKAGAQPYLIFTSVDVPFIGVSRYDISSWNYGTYANPGQT
jgi:hypothetical protein